MVTPVMKPVTVTSEKDFDVIFRGKDGCKGSDPGIHIGGAGYSFKQITL